MSPAERIEHQEEILMRQQTYMLVASIMFAALAAFFSGHGQAANEEEIANAQKVVLAIADDIANGKTDALKTKVDAYVKANINDYKDLNAPMKTMGLRDNGGVGFGAKGRFTPDGIEAQLIALDLKPPPGPALLGRAAELKKSANIIAAVSEMALKKPPKKEAEKKDWLQWAQDMKEGADALSNAIAKNNADAVQAAVKKLNTACADCHNKFKKN
jgi:hypothetical protein